MDRVVLPPYGESDATLDGSHVLAVVETAERVERCYCEAVLLPFGLEDIEDGHAPAHENVGEIRLSPVHHVLLVTAARALYIARKRQHTDDGGAAYHLLEVPDEAEVLPEEGFRRGLQASTHVVRS